MFYNKSVIERLEYLDSILDSVVFESQLLTVSFKDLYQKVNLESDYKDSYESELDKFFNEELNTEYNKKSEHSRLLLGLMFMVDNDLLKYNQVQKSVSLTYKGFILHAKGGFIREYKSERKNYILNKYNIIITLLISLATFVLGTSICKS